MNNEQGQEAAVDQDRPAERVTYNGEVRCVLCKTVGYVARYCGCTSIGAKRRRESARRRRAA